MAIHDPGIIRQNSVYAIQEGREDRMAFPYYIVNTQTNRVVAAFRSYRLAEWVLAMIGSEEIYDILSGSGRKAK
jgi:hypothetical protein